LKKRGIRRMKCRRLISKKPAIDPKRWLTPLCKALLRGEVRKAAASI
jgi:hypothetical protein